MTYREGEAKRVRNQIKKMKTGGRKRKLYSRDVQSTERMLRWDERANAALSSWSSECNVGLAAEDEEGGGKRTEERRQGERKRKKMRKQERGIWEQQRKKGKQRKSRAKQGMNTKIEIDRVDPSNPPIKWPLTKTKTIQSVSHNNNFAAVSQWVHSQTAQSTLCIIPHDCSASGHSVSFQPHYNAKTPARIGAYPGLAPLIA